jgi:hypothetical protein
MKPQVRGYFFADSRAGVHNELQKPLAHSNPHLLTAQRFSVARSENRVHPRSRMLGDAKQQVSAHDQSRAPTSWNSRGTSALLQAPL